MSWRAASPSLQVGDQNGQIGLFDRVRAQLAQQRAHLGKRSPRQALQFGGAAPGHVWVAFPELGEAARYQIDGEQELGHDVVEVPSQPASFRGRGLLLGLAEQLCLRLFELRRALLDHRLEIVAVAEQLRLRLDGVVDHLQAHRDHEAEEAEVGEDHEVERAEQDDEFLHDREDEPAETEQPEREPRRVRPAGTASRPQRRRRRSSRSVPR